MKTRIWAQAAMLAVAMQVAAAAPVEAPPLRTEFVFEARVKVDRPIVVGESSHGLRRIVPVLGGSVQGPALNGNVLAGGADWQFVRPDGAWELSARYTMQTEDGVLIMVENRGVRYGSPDVMARLAKGEKVDPDLVYCRTVATFEAPRDSKYQWMNHTLFVGSVERLPDAAIVRFYKVN